MPVLSYESLAFRLLSPFFIEECLATQGRRLFCWIPVLLGAGSGFYFSLYHEPGFYSLFGGCLALIAGVGLFLIARPELDFPLILRTVGVGSAALSAGFLLACGETHLQPPFPALPHQGAWIRGVMTQSEFLPPWDDKGAGRWRITLKNVIFESPLDERSAPLERSIRITLKTGMTLKAKVGDEVRLKALLQKTPPPIYPGAVDFQRASWFLGRAGGGRALSEPVPLKAPFSHHDNGLLSNGPLPNGLMRWETLRDDIAGKISKVLKGQNGAIVMTVLCGESSSLSQQTRQDFAASGLAHLLAVAGLHLGLVMAFCVTMVRTLLVRSEKLALYWPCRTIAYVSSLVLGALYVGLTGFHLPGLRALGMAFLVVLAMVSGREALSLRSLAVIALLLEVTRPSRIFDVSFQMSFMAVMALILGYEVLRGPLSDLGQRSWMWARIGLPLIFLALTSLLAGSAVVPVSMAHFGAFQPWFVVANMIAVPVMGFWIMPLGLVSLVAMMVGLETIPLVMMGWGVEFVRTIATFMAHVPLASLAVPHLPGWGLVLILLGICLFCLWRGKFRFAGLALLCLGMASPWLVAQPILILSPDGREILFHDQHHLYGKSHKKNDFKATFWQRAFALPIEPLPDACLKGACLLMAEGHSIWVQWPQYKERSAMLETPPVCAQISLVINLSKAGNLCPDRPTLDHHSVWREGSWSVYPISHGFLRLLSDLHVRGYRPWVMEPDQEGDPGLPLAQSE